MRALGCPAPQQHQRLAFEWLQQQRPWPLWLARQLLLLLTMLLTMLQVLLEMLPLLLLQLAMPLLLLLKRGNGEAACLQSEWGGPPTGWTACAASPAPAPAWLPALPGRLRVLLPHGGCPAGAGRLALLGWKEEKV